MSSSSAKKRKNEKGEENLLVWSVKITDFLDDYKTRGADWANTEVVLFTTQQLAYDYEKYVMIDYIKDRYESSRLDLPDSVHKCLGEDGHHDWSKVDPDDITIAYNLATKGEFVNFKQSIEIEQLPVRSSILSV